MCLFHEHWSETEEQRFVNEMVDEIGQNYTRTRITWLEALARNQGRDEDHKFYSRCLKLL